MSQKSLQKKVNESKKGKELVFHLVCGSSEEIKTHRVLHLCYGKKFYENLNKANISHKKVFALLFLGSGPEGDEVL